MAPPPLIQHCQTPRPITHSHITNSRHICRGTPHGTIPTCGQSFIISASCCPITLNQTQVHLPASPKILSLSLRDFEPLSPVFFEAKVGDLVRHPAPKLKHRTTQHHRISPAVPRGLTLWGDPPHPITCTRHSSRVQFLLIPSILMPRSHTRQSSRDHPFLTHVHSLSLSLTLFQ